VGERRQVARGPDGSLRGDHGGDAPFEERQHQLGELDAHARVAARERAPEQQEHAAHDLLRERLAGADRVGADEVDLQLRGVGGRDPHALEPAEPGRHAVDRRTALERVLDHGAARRDPLAVGVVQRRRRGAAGDRLQPLQGDPHPAPIIVIV
jgi:hypothetical protein